MGQAFDEFSRVNVEDHALTRNALLEDPNHDFETHYNRSTFMFRHGLKGHPLLELPSIIELGRRLEKTDAAYWSNGPVGVSARWEEGTSGRKSLTATLENIAENNSLVLLKSVVHDPIVGPLMREVLSTIIDFVGPALRDDVVCGRATFLIASPRRITAYHIDGDVNFLMQVAGTKLFAVYNQKDETLISRQEIESYFAGDSNGAVYKEERRHEATLHRLEGGYGAHVPWTAPHWAQNGDDVSVAVSFNFDTHTTERFGRIHKINRRLRSLGLRPRAPGASRTGDRAKLAAYRAYALAGRLKKVDLDQPDDFGWVPPRA